MRAKKYFSLLIAFVFSVSIYAKDNSKEILLSINGSGINENISKSEFKRIYLKNNTSTESKKNNVEEYLDLFINFKLKVLEACNQGYDTLSSFKEEFNNYKNKLAEPYLEHKAKKEELVKEAYERKTTAVSASHIMIKVNFNAVSPKDTLEAYNKLMEIREKYENGESFENLALEYSEDPGAKKSKGNMGYFTAFKFPYPFESAAYNTPVGEIAGPVRTNYGYHLIKVNDKKPAEGEIKVAHIMKFTPQSMSEEKKDSIKNVVYDIYEELQNGADFSEVAKEKSDDRRSAANGGEMPYFGVGRMVPAFEEVCFSLEENGEISKPLKTRYGYHIIKRINQKPLPSFEEMKDELENKIEKGRMKKVVKEAFVNDLKIEYDYEINKENLKDFISVFDSAKYFKYNWEITPDALSSALFKLKDTTIKQSDFAKYLNELRNRERYKYMHKSIFLDQRYNDFVDKTLLSYEENNLTEKYPKFRHLLNEYHDGILLFNIMDDKVWSKAVKDSTGLMTFYEENKTKYKTNKRLEVKIYVCTSEDMAKKAVKYINKRDKKAYTDSIIVEMLANDFGDTINVKHEIYEIGKDELIADLKWKKGIAKKQKYGKTLVFEKVAQLPQKQKSLKEAKGLVTSDYQDYLEKKWIESLKNKYEVNVNQGVLEEIKKEI
jgi:peptidyl-prolyl cis-trans isomerase SurA